MSSYIDQRKKELEELKVKTSKMYAWMLANTRHPDFSIKYKEYIKMLVKKDAITSRIKNFGNNKYMAEIFTPNQ